MSYLQRFTFADKGVSFAAKFVQSQAYRAARDGRRPYDAFGTAAQLSLGAIFGRLTGACLTDNPNVNVARYASQPVALTEVGLPRTFDALTLDARENFHFDDSIGTGYTTAHPLWVDGNWINYTLKFGPTSRTIVWAMNASGQRAHLGTIKSKRPSYIHSMSASGRYAILVEYPYTANALQLLMPGRAFIDNFRWDPRGTSLFHLVDLRAEREPVRCEGEAFFSFHHIVAFDDGNDVVVDLVGYDDAAIVGDLSIDRLRAGQPVTTPGIRRYRCNIANRTATRETIAGENLQLELPRVNTSVQGARRYYYGPRFRQEGFESDAVCRVDLETGEVRAYEHPGEAPSEAVFVARPGASAENDGVLLFVTYEATQGASALVVLDGVTFEELGRAEAGVRLPLGFHGQFHHETASA